MQYSYGYASEPILLKFSGIQEAGYQLDTIKNKIQHIMTEYAARANQYDIVRSSINKSSVTSHLDNGLYLCQRLSHNLKSYSEQADYLDKTFQVTMVTQGGITFGDIKGARKKAAIAVKAWNKATQLITKDGIMFRVVKSNRNYYLKAVNLPFTKLNMKSIKAGLTDAIGNKFTGNTIKKLYGNGIKISKLDGGLTKKAAKFADDAFPTLKNRILDYDMPFIDRLGSNVKTSFAKSLDIVDDFKPGSYKNLGFMSKLGKGLGAAGTAMTVITNFKSNFYENGEFKPSWEGWEEFRIETAVDVGVGAVTASTSTAIATAVGTAICPGVGTAVGFVVAVGGSYLLYHKFGDPPMSCVDHTKKFLCDGYDKIQDFAGDVKDKALDIASDAAEAAGEFIGDAAEAAGEFMDDVGSKAKDAAKSVSSWVSKNIF